MKKKYIKYLKILDILSLIILVCLLVITLIIFIDSFKYDISFTSVGIKNFLTLYLPSIQFTAALIAILTLKLTIERLFLQDSQLKKQSKQIKIAYENILYNNYYFHQKEFSYLIKNSLFFQEFSLTKKITQNLYLSLYYDFFYNSHDNFDGQLNDKSKKSIDGIMKAVDELSDHLSQSNYRNLDFSMLSTIYINLNDNLRHHCQRIFEQKLIQNGIYETGINNEDNQKKLMILSIYLIYNLYADIISFTKETYGINNSINSNMIKVLLEINIILKQGRD